MTKNLHFLAGALATCMIATFFLSTLLVELFGSHHAIATIKCLIVVPGLFILVPAIMATGGSGTCIEKAVAGDFKRHDSILSCKLLFGRVTFYALVLIALVIGFIVCLFNL